MFKIYIYKSSDNSYFKNAKTNKVTALNMNYLKSLSTKIVKYAKH